MCMLRVYSQAYDVEIEVGEDQGVVVDGYSAVLAKNLPTGI